ncbi:MAG: hypothetical protein ACFFG0_00305 [Candidatus Thorarchaeota archaeon]
MEFNEWYNEKIEDPLKELVYELRNRGINTHDSCGHSMFIQCESYDPTNEIGTIFNILWELGLKDFRVVVIHEHGNFPKRYMEIQLGDRGSNFYEKFVHNKDFDVKDVLKVFKEKE